jgi:hypothetical protein
MEYISFANGQQKALITLFCVFALFDSNITIYGNNKFNSSASVVVDFEPQDRYRTTK